MIEEFEQLVIIRYLQKNLSRNMSSRAFKEVCDFLENGLAFLGIEGDFDDLLDEIDEFQMAVRKNTGARSLYKSLYGQVLQILQERSIALADSSPGSTEENIRIISGELGFDEIEHRFFALLTRYRVHEPLYSLLNDLTREHIGILDLCSTCIDIDKNELAERLRQGSRLVSSGVIVQQNRNGKDLDDHFDVSDLIISALQKTVNNLDDVRKYILGEPSRPSLEWADFDHIANARDRLASFLTEVVRKKIAGVNILLWGPPGTGKTEFCKTLADKLNYNLYAVGESDESGEEPNRKERTNAYRIAQNLLGSQGRNILLFDEMDDLFENKGLAMLFGAKFSSGSKVFINRLLEDNPVPVIWTINEADRLDECIIRRMALAIEMKVPPAKSRKKVWQRLLENHNLSVPDQDLEKLSKIEVAPAVANNATKFAGLVGSSLEDFQFATQGIIKATKGRIPMVQNVGDEPYLPELINSQTDISQLAEQLCAASAKNFSLCLFGPPGTGKSAYVRYLADRLEMPVLHKRASDLISPYVGETEQRIAQAFEEAIDSESFLVLDEADSFLSDRRNAQRSWEVSQVNEMLTWMESHPLPFACTTNLKERLDQASMRRFTFKCHFDYLNAEQVAMAFRHFFNVEMNGRYAVEMSGLTPGDFSVVAKRLSYLEKKPFHVERIAEYLMQEVEMKDEGHKSTIGFKC